MNQNSPHATPTNPPMGTKTPSRIPIHQVKRDGGIPLSTLMDVVYPDGMAMGDGYSRCFAYLYRLALELGAIESAPAPQGTQPGITKLGNNRREMLQGMITAQQERSFWILWKWWRACSYTCVAIDEDELFGGPVDDDSDSDPEAHFYPQVNKVRQKIHEAEGVKYELRFDSLYNTALAFLFNAEFDNFEIYRSGEHLVAKREYAAQGAACLNVALESLSEGSPAIPSFGDDPLDHRSELRLEPQIPRRCLGQDDLSGLDRRCTTGSSIESCPWLTEIVGFPFYLWDTKQRKTVETAHLLDTYDYDVPYTAISHTWGRWRERSKPGVNMKPHVPWLVPQNTLFDVKTLPDILAQVPTDTPYIWFDLVCIPQEDCGEILDPQLRKTLVTEIASQAAIFKGAKHAIAWWNTEISPDTWDGMRCAIRWMSSVYLNLEFSNERPVKVPRGDGVDAPATGMFSSKEKKTMPWFSSLWTLQEVCLRPDIWLCTKNWDLLTVGEGTLVAFNTIVALTKRVIDIVVDGAGDTTVPAQYLPAKWEGHYHHGFLELVELLNRTGMADLHRLKREHILFLATSRHCSHSRAQAIMSVLGMKAWYDPDAREQRQPGKPGFVFDQYPLRFVEEVATNLQSAFFTAVLIDPPVTQHDQARGTMLPFRANMDEQKILAVPDSEATDHPSVATWRIRGDGTVLLEDVEILFSSESRDAGFPYLKCFFQLSVDVPRPIVKREHLQPQGEMHHGSLKRWIKEIIPEIYGAGLYYAVHLRIRKGGWDGLLLKSTGQSPPRMFKIGNVHALTLLDGKEYLPRCPVQAVNWIVL
ncbi:hypothetical protein LOZ65_006740 [Ophidiomyces ophidiicola]|nr:hypothetical protein LOZ65_006740 [Ophidiomyces ophidiicola]